MNKLVLGLIAMMALFSLIRAFSTQSAPSTSELVLQRNL